jgi:hypothetical protein
MKLPLAYQLYALDGSISERGIVLQDVRDHGILEAEDLAAFTFKIEALLEDAEKIRIELEKDLIEARRDHINCIEKIRTSADMVFDDLITLLPKHADMIRAQYIELLRNMT